MNRHAASTRQYSLNWIIPMVFCILFGTFQSVVAQETGKTVFNRDSLISAAREIIEISKYCALITLDKTGHPHARTMQPFPPEENMVIWFGTNPNTRKVEQIKNDPRVTVYYGDPSGDGYVVITGEAILVNDKKEKEKRWMDEWEAFYPDREESYLLIKVIPNNLEVVSYKHGLTGDSVTWKAPAIEFDLK